ncbi:alpha/beta hydrolase family protein [Paracerasibacillus soli]|uniref:MarR family transcriptional regulator n=1 Tax=Paracerasibacillus soli TaxID=480284 RepID=A0ABU5CVD0_9BACI|nr:MarR family transcriptional regulator [Virgibacillus soli]MDY0410332.1 MarR family transcriptional regulator [Virgibacillus soli]
MLRIHKKGLFLFMLTLLLLLIGCQDTKKEDKIRNDIAGRWTGAIQVPNQPLEIEVTFSEDNEWNGAITIPIQGVEDYPFKKVDVSQGDITFTMEMNGQLLTFEGEIKDAEMKGSFTQQGQTFPFELKKGKQTSEKEVEEEGQFLSIETDYGTLYGELAIPKNDGPFPVVLIIPGSGPTDRNGNSLGITNNSLKMVAEELAENGVASLRYDKRGAGKNQLTNIKEEDLDFNQFVEDATLWVRALKEERTFYRCRNHWS